MHKFKLQLYRFGGWEFEDELRTHVSTQNGWNRGWNRWIDRCDVLEKIEHDLNRMNERIEFHKIVSFCIRFALRSVLASNESTSSSVTLEKIYYSGHQISGNVRLDLDQPTALGKLLRKQSNLISREVTSFDNFYEVDVLSEMFSTAL